MPDKCPDCHEPIPYFASHCRCGTFIGFPNRRAAEAEHAELAQRSADAITDATRRGASALLAELNRQVEQSLPVIAMYFEACDDILRDRKYLNYHKQVEFGMRPPATIVNHGDRAMVGERLFPNYSAHIQYAALSPSGAGLATYGPVAVRWLVTPTYLGRRISLLEENSFTFFEKHGLGTLHVPVPPGWRATWEDRSILASAKIGSRLTSATAADDIADMVLHIGATRQDDNFIEVHIYDEKGLDRKDVDRVTCQKAPATPEEHFRWDLIKEICASLRINIVEQKSC
jgi:hypothetical protein